MENDQFLQLLDKYLLETISPEETRTFFAMLEDPACQDIMRARIGDDLHQWNGPVADHQLPALPHRIKSLIATEAAGSQTAPVRSLKKWIYYAAAAVVLFAVAGAWFYNSTKTTTPALAHTLPSPVTPGSNKALLTLGDGTSITLQDAATGKLAVQGDVQVVKLPGGQLAYQGNGKSVLWNTMSTPAGGQYQLILPDGTKVWLNAASAITYPTAFNGISREVKIRGEVYMEVAKNSRQPFMVDVDGRSKVEVLGTGFNINAYPDEEAIRTTLAEGSIKVRGLLLSPGQQAQEEPGKSIVVNAHADVQQTLAWKNGQFNFDGMSMKAVLRQLERWYDVKAVYRRQVDEGAFGGRVDRNSSLRDVLDILEKISGEKFKVEGRSVIVQ